MINKSKNKRKLSKKHKKHKKQKRAKQKFTKLTSNNIDQQFRGEIITYRLECPVCLEHFSNDLPPYVLSCGHNICFKDQSNLDNCPICREVIWEQQPCKNYEL